MWEWSSLPIFSLYYIQCDFFTRQINCKHVFACARGGGEGGTDKISPCIFGILFFISVNSIRGEELSCGSAVGVYQSHRRACTTHPLSEFAPKILLNKTKILPNTNPLSEFAAKMLLNKTKILTNTNLLSEFAEKILLTKPKYYQIQIHSQNLQQKNH